MVFIAATRRSLILCTRRVVARSFCKLFFAVILFVNFFTCCWGLPMPGNESFGSNLTSEHCWNTEISALEYENRGGVFFVMMMMVVIMMMILFTPSNIIPPSKASRSGVS